MSFLPTCWPEVDKEALDATGDVQARGEYVGDEEQSADRSSKLRPEGATYHD